jgi:translocator protein
VLALVGFVGLALLVGAAGNAVTTGSLRTWYLTLVRPPGAPPAWLFTPVWTALYVLIGTAAWMVWREPGHRRPLLLWGWQLILLALWNPVFFGLQRPGLALAVIVPVLLLAGATLRAFLRVHRLAGWLLAPYLAWIAYATWLDAGFWWLNRG